MKLVWASLVINPHTNCRLWCVNVDMNSWGYMQVEPKEPLNQVAHIVHDCNNETLCGKFKLKKNNIIRIGSDGWYECRAQSMVTSVEHLGTAKISAEANITFVRLCEKCFSKAPYGIILKMLLQKGAQEVSGLARGGEDLTKWKECGLYV